MADEQRGAFEPMIAAKLVLTQTGDNCPAAHVWDVVLVSKDGLQDGRIEYATDAVEIFHTFSGFASLSGAYLWIPTLDLRQPVSLGADLPILVTPGAMVSFTSPISFVLTL